MIRVWLAVAGIGGLVSVVAGAAAAHFAADPKAADLLRTGALYGMVHAAALLAVIGLAPGREAGREAGREPGRGPGRGAAAVAGWSFVAGIVLFSFSLFVLALGGARWFGWATPFGGAAFMLGWAALGTLAVRRR